MAGESKSDNKFFQIIMVVITSIVAPVSVYYLTKAVEAKDPILPTQQPIVTIVSGVEGIELSSPAPSPLPSDAPTALALTATSPAPSETATLLSPSLTPTSTLENTPVPPTATATLSQPVNPQGLLPAGEPIEVSPFSILIKADDITLKDKAVSVKIHVRNQSSSTQTFAYKLQSLVVKGPDGNLLEPLYGEKKDSCRKQDLEVEKKIQLEPNQGIVLQSVSADKPGDWCARDSKNQLPLYFLDSKEAIKFLTIEFNQFGIFKNFGFKIEF